MYARSGVKQSVPSVCQSVYLSVCLNNFENRTIYLVMPSNSQTTTQRECHVTSLVPSLPNCWGWKTGDEANTKGALWVAEMTTKVTAKYYEVRSGDCNFASVVCSSNMLLLLLQGARLRFVLYCSFDPAPRSFFARERLRQTFIAPTTSEEWPEMVMGALMSSGSLRLAFFNNWKDTSILTICLWQSNS